MSAETAGPATRLWEVDHPYYAKSGNFYVAPADSHREGIHREYDSWTEFIDARGGSDPDCALVYRWDWQAGEDGDPDTLDVFWIIQANAICQSSRVTVSRDDEPAIRAWLAERAKTITALWAPLDLTVQADLKAEVEGRLSVGDVVLFLRRERDEYEPRGVHWNVVDDVLDAFLLHMVTGTPLTEPRPSSGPKEAGG